ncbi:chitobiase/beta-hexosaminidase C-terminal domain-containing protein [Mucilaginibacter sp. BJC16-A38]|uniref:c-type cytochrome domain-containing protein n=1 Tax=Mucilaginibacter phenanthrenivorans TaxID=1234842 RepID=UPI00215724E0|nr:c-type cytochrome domain-containing protein [Mucilaginibacter phenanthrenivorans]MCR8561471.1 chitobiase/beta-hexosaminidase C-terminal domain-containing protein [Mucilaginibacter phenanthrenivorans]
MIKSKHKGFAENLLFALNIFIIFLLVFGSAIVIPQWLQPVGRLHPLILHFPIVVLIMAMMLEFFRFKDRFKTEKLYHDFTTYLWLTGAIFAAFTAIMGLFLSKEPGYEGGTLQWHKWLGVSVVFVSTIIYWCRSAGWYNVKTARWGAGVVVLSLVFAGHFGADLTHGDNFVLAPVWHPEKDLVPLDKALVYKDVIQPIFQSKCISCHNPDKTKGGLMLIDEKSILKGGKDGKLIVPGQPQISMLLQRIHLVEEDKKHMPPAGKPQLTPDEMDLLYLWVKENADFKKKVIALPAKDSLRMIASTYLKPAEETEEKYDFAAADDKLIKKLNNNYRVIYPYAKESPALGVNIYNKSTYRPKTLEELSAIKQQVVSLDVSKMPVKDAELKTIAQFENLHTLNLNFTDVTGSTLKDLASLKSLKMISLAGTPLNASAIKQISALKSLAKITLWDTGLTDAQLNELQAQNKKIEFIKSFKDDGKPIKLNVPQLKNTALVFAESMPLELSHPIKGVQIRYTTDGTDPDSIKSPVFKPGVAINKNTNIKVKAYKAGWLSSDVVQFSVFKSTYTPDSISFIKQPNPKYSADGAKSLIDKDLGGTNFGNSKWIGAQNNIEIYMQFNKPADVHNVTINCLRNLGSQIFLPIGIEVWGGTDINHLKLLSNVTPPAAKKDEPVITVGIDCKLNIAKPINCLKIIAKNIQTLPAWDPVKKGPEWVFMDEIFLN